MTAFEFETIDKSLKISAARYENEANREQDVGAVLFLTSVRLAIEAARRDLYRAFLSAGVKVVDAVPAPNPTADPRTTAAADMFETTDAVIGHVTPVDNGWEVAFAPDCTTWVTVRRDEHDEPKVGDSITVTVPKVVAIHSQPNPSGQATAHGQG